MPVAVKIIAALDAKGVEPEDLDDLVHDLKAEEAADINNGGLTSQVEYLLSAGLTVEQIIERSA